MFFYFVFYLILWDYSFVFFKNVFVCFFLFCLYTLWGQMVHIFLFFVWYECVCLDAIFLVLVVLFWHFVFSFYRWSSIDQTRTINRKDNWDFCIIVFCMHGVYTMENRHKKKKILWIWFCVLIWLCFCDFGDLFLRKKKQWKRGRKMNRMLSLIMYSLWFKPLVCNIVLCFRCGTYYACFVFKSFFKHCHCRDYDKYP